ncbi:MAG: WD40 repeat domain-containing protein [Bacteroidota bacterium]
MRLFSLLTCLAFFSCQRQMDFVLPSSPRTITLWDATWSPDGQYVAVGGSIDTVRILSTRSFEVVKKYPIKETITKLRWHPTAAILAVATQNSEDGLVLINLETDELQYVPRILSVGGRGLGWNATGEILAFGDYEGDISFFNTQGQLLRKVATGQKAVIDLSWHPFRNEVLTVSEYISHYDYESDTFLPEVNDRDEQVEVLMLCVAWHPSGKFYVTGDYGDFVENYPPLLQFWDAKGNHLRKFAGGTAEYRNLRWNPDGTILASASEALRLWSPQGDLLMEQPSPQLLWGVDWSPNGKKLITSGDDGVLAFWNEKLRRIAGANYTP